MFNWIRKIWTRSPPVPAVLTSTAADSAKDYLNALRADELSIGAAYRRGETVASAPAASSNVSAPRSGPNATPPRPVRTPPVAESGGATKGEDFFGSALIGAATGSAAAGYLVGGSLLGGMVGTTAFDGVSSSPPSADRTSSPASDTPSDWTDS